MGNPVVNSIMLASKGLLVLGILVSIAAGAPRPWPINQRVCIGSCSLDLGTITFAGTDGAACNNALRLSSTFYCARIHCDPADIEPGINWLADPNVCPDPLGRITYTAYQNLVANV